MNTKTKINKTASTAMSNDLYYKSLAAAASLLKNLKTIKNLDLREATELNHAQANDFFKEAMVRGDLIKHGNTSSTCYSLSDKSTNRKNG